MTDNRNYKEVVQFASKNRGEGVLIEPRAYFDFLNYVDASNDLATQVWNTDPGSFTNGEQFPVRLTHFIVSPNFKVATFGTDIVAQYVYLDALQSVKLRIERYDEYYMNEFLINAPAWHNVNIAPPVGVGNALVTRTLPHAVVLSARDSFRVECERVPFGAIVGVSASDAEPLDTVTGSVAVTFTFTGVGMRSGRVYTWGDTLNFYPDGPSIQSFDPAQLQNVGGEPVAVTQMSFQVGPGEPVSLPDQDLIGPASAPAMFDTRLFRVGIKQQGNGTQADFQHGPTYPTEIRRMPLSLWGTDVGQSVVHQFPGDGLLLDPGQTVRVQGTRLAAIGADQDARNAFAAGLHYPEVVSIGLLGYLMVK
jgi:hypothetical protein